eukprot:gene2993-5003_t
MEFKTMKKTIAHPKTTNKTETTKILTINQEQLDLEKHSRNLKRSVLSNDKLKVKQILSLLEKKYKKKIFMFYTQALQVVFQNSKNEMLDIITDYMKEYDQKDRIYIYNRILKYCLKTRQLAKAIEIFDFIIQPNNQHQPNSTTFELVIEMHHILYTSKTKIYFEIMTNEYHLQPTIEIFYFLIKGYFGEKNIELANEYFEMIEDYNLIPNQKIFYTMISGYCQLNKIEEAMKLFEMMIQNYSLQPSMAICHQILKTLFQTESMNKERRGIQFFKDVVSKYNIKPDKQFLDLFIRNLSEIGEMDLAVECFEMMEAKFDIRPTMFSFESIIRGFCEEKNMEEAVKYFNLMKDYSMIPTFSIYKRMANAFSELKESDIASEYSSRMTKLKIEYKTKLEKTEEKTEISDRLSSLRERLAKKSIEKQTES